MTNASSSIFQAYKHDFFWPSLIFSLDTIKTFLKELWRLWYSAAAHAALGYSMVTSLSLLSHSFALPTSPSSFVLPSLLFLFFPLNLSLGNKN